MKYLKISLFFSMIVVLLISCDFGGGNSGQDYSNQKNYSSPIKKGSLLGKVFKIVDFVNLALEVNDLIKTATSDCANCSQSSDENSSSYGCDCENDFAYLVASSDRRKGVSIYIDGSFVGDADRKHAFMQVVSPGNHTILAQDNRRNRKWEYSVDLGCGQTQYISFNREDWEKDND